MNKRLDILVDKYEKLTSDKLTFAYNLPNIVEIALNIMLELANKAEMPIQPVVLESLRKLAYMEEVGDLVDVTLAEEKIFEFIDAKPINAYIMYVDFTSSTKYFIPDNPDFRYKQNYTGFVIFNAFLIVFKSYLRLYLKDYNGEFIEHTGDGFSFIIKNNSLLEVHLTRLICISEVLREIVEKYGLLHIGRDTMSLIHIGLSHGNGRRVIISGEKKFVSPATWLAAKACQKASRDYNLSSYKLKQVFDRYFDKIFNDEAWSKIDKQEQELLLLFDQKEITLSFSDGVLELKTQIYDVSLPIYFSEN